VPALAIRGEWRDRRRFEVEVDGRRRLGALRRES